MSVRTIVFSIIMLSAQFAGPTSGSFKSAQALKLEVGKMATPIQVKTLLQAPSGTIEAERLKGKVIVLEFCATWCAPCIRRSSI